VSYLLDAWGRPYTSTTNETLTLITAELVANAVRHGRVPGWDFEVRLVATVELLRVEMFAQRIRAPDAGTKATRPHAPSHAATQETGMDREQILKLYAWQLGACFRHPAKGEVPTTHVWTVRTAAGGTQDIRACEECVTAMEDMRRETAYRRGAEYEPGRVSEA
jgi:hypothetical protein